MNDKEIEEYLRKIEEGLEEAQNKMLQEYALHDDDLVIGDSNGNVLHVPAKQLLRQAAKL